MIRLSNLCSCKHLLTCGVPISGNLPEHFAEGMDVSFLKSERLRNSGNAGRALKDQYTSSIHQYSIPCFSLLQNAVLSLAITRLWTSCNELSFVSSMLL